MSDLNNTSTPSSTVTPIATTTPSVYSTTVETNTLTLNNYTVDGITDDISSADPNKLLTAYGVYRELGDIYKAIADLTEEVENIEVLPVLSDPMLPTNFIGNDWFLHGWYLDNGKALYLSEGKSNTDDNHVKIKTDAITEKGNYYLHIVVDRIDSGTLLVKDENENILGKTNVIGNFQLTIPIQDSSIAYIKFEAQDVAKDGVIQLGYAGLHHVKNAFEEYIAFTAETILSGGSGFVTKDVLETGLNNILSESKQYTNSIAGNTAELVSTHLAATNPHNITPESIGAALETHIHEQYALKVDVNTSIEDLRTSLTDLINTKVQEGITESSNNSTKLLNQHINNKNNPHETTPDKIGAANKVHTHDHNDGSLINVAAAKHTHISDDILGVADVITDARNAVELVDAISVSISNHLAEFEELENKVTVMETNVNNNITSITNILDQTNAHYNNYNNPHRTSKEHIGLGDVINGPMATDQEAIDGEKNDCYMNPKNNRAVLDYFTGDEERLAATLTPRLVLNKRVTIETNEKTGRPIPKEIILSTSGSQIYHAIIQFDGEMDETRYSFKYNVKTPDLEFPDTDPYIHHTSLTEILNTATIENIVTTKDIIDETTNEVTGTEEVIDRGEITYLTLNRRNSGIGFGLKTKCTNPICELTINTKELTITGSCIGYNTTEELREIQEEEDIYVPEIEGDIVDPDQPTLEDTLPEDPDIPEEEPAKELVTIYRTVHAKLYGRGIVLQGKREELGVSGVVINLCGSANIRIYELVATEQDPGIIIDASPIGNIITRLGDIHIPGYSLLDGSELVILQHQKLYDYAVAAGLLVDKIIYDTDLADNGYTEYFGYEEGSNYFSLPKDPVTNSKYNRYIKIDELYVPSEKQLIYRYVWN